MIISSVFDVVSYPTDHEYLAIRDQPRFSGFKDLLQDLWRRYEPFADPDFKIELGLNFHARFWEMYLANVLMDSGLELAKDRPTHGPDLLVRAGRTRIWIEAVAPGPGFGPDALPELDEMEMFKRVPEEKIILRLTSVISDKKRKFEDYTAKNIVSERDFAIIAVNGRRIPDVILEDEIPFIVKAVLPFGDPYAVVDLEHSKVVGQGYHHRASIKKKKGSEVPTKSFLSRDYANISALLYSFADIWNYPQHPGSEFVSLQNPMATRQLPLGWLKVGREFWIEDNKLERRQF